ncbi:hypothetical protein predicted by Glimmer/Critica [Lactiplantibacillus plantarum]|nr:hypothetical protein predicted by Glimmer/Critica [Lactiplantibacillus plantarum]
MALVVDGTAVNHEFIKIQTEHHETKLFMVK